MLTPSANNNFTSGDWLRLYSEPQKIALLAIALIATASLSLCISGFSGLPFHPAVKWIGLETSTVSLFVFFYVFKHLQKPFERPSCRNPNLLDVDRSSNKKRELEKPTIQDSYEIEAQNELYFLGCRA